MMSYGKTVTRFTEDKVFAKIQEEVDKFKKEYESEVIRVLPDDILNHMTAIINSSIIDIEGVDKCDSTIKISLSVEADVEYHYTEEDTALIRSNR